MAIKTVHGKAVVYRQGGTIKSVRVKNKSYMVKSRYKAGTKFKSKIQLHGRKRTYYSP